MQLSPEAILIRWVNYHMEAAGINRRINNFTSDIKDSVVYTHLLKQIEPEGTNLSTEALFETNLTKRKYSNLIFFLMIKYFTIHIFKFFIV